MTPNPSPNPEWYRISYTGRKSVDFRVVEDNATALNTMRVEVLQTGKKDYLVNLLKDDWQEIKEIDLNREFYA